jgi:hypothetical protein
MADIRHEAGAATKILEWFDKVKRSKERILDKHFLLLKILAINLSKRITSSVLVKNLRTLPQVKVLTKELLL